MTRQLFASPPINGFGKIGAKGRSLITADPNPNLTAEIDLSDPDPDLGAVPIDDSTEDTPMFTPRSSSRVIRVISKQSNV